MVRKVALAHFGSGSGTGLFGGGLTQPTLSFSGKTDFTSQSFHG